MSNNYKLWIFAGEASGDIYGANLASEVKKVMEAQGKEVEISGMGGKRMKDAGVNILVDSTELGVVGLIEVLGQIFTFIKLFFFLKKKAIEERPDAIVLIDYPGFNLRFAKALYKTGIPVIWYISPQVWAWGKKRIPVLAKVCRKMMVIFPFEVDTYSKTDLDIEFIGHPLIEVIRGKMDPNIKRDPEKVLLLPGSRFSEINRLLKPMLETTIELHKRQPQLKFIIAAPREKVFHRIKEIYNEFSKQHQTDQIPEIDIRCGETNRWIQEAGTGLAASGTVTVECAIAGLPLVVAYKVNPLTYCLGKMLVKIPYFTMVNIIAEKEVFHEFLQKDVNDQTLSTAIEKVLPNGSRRKEVESDIKAVIETLSGGSERASIRAAQVCSDLIINNRK